MATAMAQPRSGIGRVFEHRYLQYRRTFRATIFSSFLTPVLFLTAMGLGLGSYVDSGTATASLGGVPYLAFLAPGPARRDVHAVGGVRGGLPDDVRAALVAHLPRDGRGADQRPGRGPRQPRLDRRADAPRRLGVHGRHRRVRGGDVAARRVCHPGRGADRAGVRGPDHGLLRDPEDAREVQRRVPVRDHAAVPVQRHVLPGRVAAAAHPAAGLDHAAVARRVAGSRAVAGGRSARSR